MTENTEISIELLDGQEALRSEVSDIFVDAYYASLSGISKDKRKLSAAFANAFLLNRFYGAFIKDRLVGFFALTDANERCLRLVERDFREQFGFLKGKMVYSILRKEFEHKIELRERGYNIECVATSPEFQGRGIAKKMMMYAMENNPYLELDVVDTNLVALKLYERLGFKSFREVPIRFFRKMTGYNKRIFMYYRNDGMPPA